jgi:hypothetical protein
MKKLALTGVATMALALGAFAQGSVNVDNQTLSPYICVTDANTHYNGPATIQVWELNGTTIPSAFAGVDGSVAGGNGAYALLAGGSGFRLEATFTKTIADGILVGQPINMPDVSPAGSSVVMALAINNQSSWNWTGTTKGGLAVFVNPTSDYTASPVPTPKDLTGWDALGQNFVMQPVPEPSTFALAGLGAAALLIFRRRK